jgi:hypothetical protein
LRLDWALGIHISKHFMEEKLYLLSCVSSSHNPTRPVMSNAKDKPKDGTLLKRISNSVI